MHCLVYADGWIHYPNIKTVRCNGFGVEFPLEAHPKAPATQNNTSNLLIFGSPPSRYSAAVATHLLLGDSEGFAICAQKPTRFWAKMLKYTLPLSDH